MAEGAYKYIIVGGGLAGASAAEGIREIDKEGSVLIVGREVHLPYHRPPLTKKLWFGKEQVGDIFVKNAAYYEENNIDTLSGVDIVGLVAADKTVTDSRGNHYGYDKVLLATGGTPRKLSISGADSEGICYYRYLDDYKRIRAEASEGKTATVIGGGFIGSEIAAALCINKVDVTMIFPEKYIVQRVFSEDLGIAVQEEFIKRGIRVMAEDLPDAIEKRGGKFVVRTRGGKTVESDILLVGVGIHPSIELAEDAGLMLDNGIVVNEYLQTSNPSIYAAGDNAYFQYEALGRRVRVEHWDNALSQGKQVGRNMAGANEPYTYMPYFFSDLFDFGYEAVGDIDSRFEIFADWKTENETGVVYYLKDGIVVGAMMCNVWDKVEDARQLIKSKKRMTYDDLRGAIG